MAYTVVQQAKLDIAQAQVDSTKPAYESAAASYTGYMNGIDQSCHSGSIPTADEVKTGSASPNRSSCNNAGPNSCKNACQSNIDYLNDYMVGPLRTAWQNYKSALDNFNTVQAQVIAETAGDPATLAEIEAAKQAEKTETNKWIFFGLLLLIIAGISAWMIIKKVKIKKRYIIGSALAMAAAGYILIFGLTKRTA